MNISLNLLDVFPKTVDEKQFYYDCHPSNGEITVYYQHHFGKVRFKFSKNIKVNGIMRSHIYSGSFKLLEKKLEEEGWSTTIWI